MFNIFSFTQFVGDDGWLVCNLMFVAGY